MNNNNNNNNKIDIPIKMKYLESDIFDALNCALSSIETPDEKIIGRLEAYSCNYIIKS